MKNETIETMLKKYRKIENMYFQEHFIMSKRADLKNKLAKQASFYGHTIKRYLKSCVKNDVKIDVDIYSLPTYFLQFLWKYCEKYSKIELNCTFDLKALYNDYNEAMTISK